MEFSWTTFILEVINFLVLVWILKRFLYKPVMDAIAQRKAAIEKSLADGKALQNSVQKLKEQYENRLSDWEREKEKARTQLLDEIKTERDRLMAGLQASLEQEREKNRILEKQHIDELRRGIEEEAMIQGGRFAARFLARLAGPDLEAKIVELVLEDLSHLPDEKRQMICTAYREARSKMFVASAFPLGKTQLDALTKAVSHLIGQDVAYELRQDHHLVCGLLITIGPWVLRANLQDELVSFTEATREPT